MKILFDTSDVKLAIRKELQRSGIITKDTEVTMDITKLRTGEDIRVEITIVRDEDVDEILASDTSEGIDDDVIDDQGDDSDELNPFSSKLSE